MLLFVVRCVFAAARNIRRAAESFLRRLESEASARWQTCLHLYTCQSDNMQGKSGQILASHAGLRRWVVPERPAHRLPSARAKTNACRASGSNRQDCLDTLTEAGCKLLEVHDIGLDGQPYDDTSEATMRAKGRPPLCLVVLAQKRTEIATS
jgi:hypothetical protein